MAFDRIGRAVHVEFTDARADQRCCDKGRQAADHVHHAGTGEVDDTGSVTDGDIAQPAAAPDPVTVNRVNNSAQDKTVSKVRGNFHSFRDGAGDDGSGGSGEHHLEEPEHNGRYIITVARQEEAGHTEECIAFIQTREGG